MKSYENLLNKQKLFFLEKGKIPEKTQASLCCAKKIMGQNCVILILLYLILKFSCKMLEQLEIFDMWKIKATNLEFILYLDI